MTLPARRKLLTSGILRGPKREWPRHRKFVRSHDCVVTLTVQGECEGPIEFSHNRTAATAGVGIKSHDCHGTPMCAGHHRELHNLGAKSFEAKYRLDLAKIAAEFTAKSPDLAMRESLQCE